MADPAEAEKGLGGARTRHLPEVSGDGEGQQLDFLGGVAELQNARRRGRPAGAVNRRNDAQFDYYEALGFKAPERFLLELVSADTKDLAKRLGADPLKLLAEQRKAAADLLPYKLARKPQEHEIRKAELHLFVAGDMSPEALKKVEENQWFDVRQLGMQSDGEVVPVADQEVKGSNPDD
jgi:hypothetical protein